MPKLDLNAKRAARAAERQEPFTIDLNGEEFTLVDEVPLSATDTTEGFDMASVVRELLADPERDYERFMAARPTMNDVLEIIQFYGVSLGESLPSNASSTNTGASSRPTFSVTTPSISARPVGENEGPPAG